MTLRLTFCGIGPFQINFWRQELRMSEISQHGNEAELCGHIGYETESKWLKVSFIHFL